MKKRIISALLAVLIAVSGLTLSAFSTAAAEKNEHPEYLLGDVDLDGEVSVIDATLIIRHLALLYELSGLQTELARVDGEELSVRSATFIQRYLAEMETGLPIGESAGDEYEGIVYTEKAMSYTCVAGQVIQQQDKVTLSTAYPDVAFISDSDMIQAFAMFAGYQTCDLTVESDENTHSFTLPFSC